MDWVAGLQEYVTVKVAAWPVDWLVIRKPLRTIGCVVHGLAAMPQPEDAGGWLSAKSSYANSSKFRICPLVSTRPVAALVPIMVVTTTDVRAVMTRSPIAVATIRSIRV